MSALSLQAGAGSVDGSLDPKLGIVAIRLKCWAPDLATAITGDLPEFGVSGLVENQPRSFSRNEAGDQGGYEVSATVEGHLTPDDADGEEYSIEGTTSEDPVEAHWNYQELLDVYEGTEDPASGRAKWPKEIGEDGAPNPMHGVESYLVPGLVWTRKFVSLIPPASILHTLGTIETPPGNPPALYGNRTWLKVRVRGTKRGNIWQIEESWMISGPDGWVPEMYRYQ